MPSGWKPNNAGLAADLERVAVHRDVLAEEGSAFASTDSNRRPSAVVTASGRRCRQGQ